ncbi:MAG: hypothetical protein IJX98_00240 [Clostridia bacterium]|nr:hypothetical protein [Clostridia bacterium]
MEKLLKEKTLKERFFVLLLGLLEKLLLGLVKRLTAWLETVSGKLSSIA